jgi:hypothetical protein
VAETINHSVQGFAEYVPLQHEKEINILFNFFRGPGRNVLFFTIIYQRLF